VDGSPDDPGPGQDTIRRGDGNTVCAGELVWRRGGGEEEGADVGGHDGVCYSALAPGHETGAWKNDGRCVELLSYFIHFHKSAAAAPSPRHVAGSKSNTKTKSARGVLHHHHLALLMGVGRRGKQNPQLSLSSLSSSSHGRDLKILSFLSPSSSSCCCLR
jgi:hypothetical protein